MRWAPLAAPTALSRVRLLGSKTGTSRCREPLREPGRRSVEFERPSVPWLRLLDVDRDLDNVPLNACFREPSEVVLVKGVSLLQVSLEDLSVPSFDVLMDAVDAAPC